MSSKVAPGWSRRGHQYGVDGLAITQAADSCDAIRMPILLIILIVLVILSFGGGLYQPAYRRHGISVGTVLLIVLVLWLLGVFGSRPY